MREKWPPLKQAFIIFGLLFVSIGVFLLAVSTVPSYFGFMHATVASGSMMPVLNPGDVIWFEDVSPDDIDPGNIIVFESLNGSDTVHRVIANDRNAGVIITKGDANEAIDGAPVAYHNIKGILLFKMAGIGAAVFSGDGLAMAVLIAGCGSMFLIMGAMYRPQYEQKKRKREDVYGKYD